MDGEELLTDDEISHIKITCDTVAYRDPKTFDGDRHFVARAVAQAQLEKMCCMRRAWMAEALERLSAAKPRERRQIMKANS